MNLLILRSEMLCCVVFLLPLLVKAQSSSSIYILTMDASKDTVRLTNPRLVTKHKGYNNQPFFHTSLPLLYYASADDSGHTDIKSYNYSTQVTQSITNTVESEYSPALTPGSKFISCVIARPGGQQDLGNYPLNGGKASVVIDNLKIGYYGWTSDSTLLLFVLKGDGFEMHYYNVSTKQDSILPIKPGRCFVKIPGEDAMSFIDKSDSSHWVIKKWMEKNRTIETIAMCPCQQEDFTWTKNGLLITGKGSRLFSYNPKGRTPDWSPVLFTGVVSVLKKITRISVNAENNMLAVVTED